MSINQSGASEYSSIGETCHQRAGRGIEQGWGDGDGDGDGSSSSSPLIIYDKDAIDPEDDMHEGPHDLPESSSGGGSSASASNTLTPYCGDLSLPECYPVSNKRLMPGTVSKTITKIMKKKIHTDGVNLKGVPGPHRQVYFEEYKKWLAYWSFPEVIAKSEMACQNRYSEKAGPNTACSSHSGGSGSALEHSLALQKESARALNAYQCFLRTHKRKDGTFVDKRSRLIATGVEERVAAARQVAGDAPIDMTKLYLEVVGGMDRQASMGSGHRQMYSLV